MSTDLNTCLGVELKMISAQVYSCRYVLLNRNKNKLTVLGKGQAEGSLATVLKDLSKSYPVALCLTGKDTVHKNIIAPLDSDSDQLTKLAFASIEPKEFYIQCYGTGENYLVSIVRKSVVDVLLSTLAQAGLKILNISLGAMVSVQLLPLINISENAVCFDGHEFVLGTGNMFDSYRYHVPSEGDRPVKIAEEKIIQQQVLAYSGAFQLLMHDHVVLVRADHDKVNEDFTVFLQNGKLKNQGLFFLIGLFVALLLSFLIFSYYNGQNAKLHAQVGERSSTADQADQFRQRIAERERVLKSVRWNGGYNYGFLLNAIGKSKTNGIRLSAVKGNFYKTESEKQAKLPNFYIEGFTANLTALNNWLFDLKEQSWVKSAQLLKCQATSESEEYQFILLILY